MQGQDPPPKEIGSKSDKKKKAEQAALKRSQKKGV